LNSRATGTERGETKSRKETGRVTEETIQKGKDRCKDRGGKM
jgi:hypothetical protein